MRMVLVENCTQGASLMQNAALFRALEEFEFDQSGSAGAFAARLAREQGWTPEYTRRTVDEYRRFLYLAVTGEGAATPSQAVDEVWHLHLLYTRSYWDELCPKVLGRPLHHDPSSGGAAEEGRYAKQYNATLESYRREFGAVPPPDIWIQDSTLPARPLALPSLSRWLLRAGIPVLVAAALAIAAAAADNLGADAPRPALFSLYDILAGVFVFALCGFTPACIFALIIFIANPLLDLALGPVRGYEFPLILAFVICAVCGARSRPDSGGSSCGGGGCVSRCGDDD